MHKLPPLIELRAFEAAARHLSFKKAAAELGVTPTAISHQIGLLEQYCGRALFRRRPRPLSLTDAGAQLFPAIRGGLEAFAAAIASLKQEGDEQPLRVTTTNAFASRWLVPRLPLWRKLHPDVPLEVIGTDTVLDLQAGDSDVAIRYATSRVPPTDGIVDELFSDTFLPVCSPDLLSTGRLKRPIDLANHVLIHSYWSPTDREPPTWQRWLTAAQRRWREVPQFKDMQHLSFREELHAIEAVIAGQGVGIFSDVLVAHELAVGMLVKPFKLSLSGYSFYVVTRPSNPRARTIRAFSEWLRSST
ncbi:MULTISPECIES: LysR substrate-binding domain-containing protein [unclassified Bradyrhizobium]|uniref:LysR substrate-binding domain-containing protein n=1 Tax=unclassified Bradyrhizobium TaxID=2631580 RepID=UPI001CD77E3E|nr:MULTISPECIES: LysR substrate-binding domain-containing protein [unclassified Bradyrhizobium]MCA1379117.1 LysR family transcriptional regulator [Bradyrhizobium sp. IC4060]MCA1488525.1 LysR family transcriptional regulator [Bradyrhizobium sp. IC4061]